MFHRRKKAFLKELERRHQGTSGGSPGGGYDVKKALESFEKWLREEKDVPQKSQPINAKTFDEFVDEVLLEVKELLAPRGINIVFSLPGQSLGIIESWKCVKVFDNTNIYYRIGRTRPRKGPSRGQDLLVLDLVMDGHKKQVFLPLLEMKSEIEKKLGNVLERELPKVEATGKYRLKIHLPIESVQGDVGQTAHKFADFISVTKPILNQFGIT
ncbi:MAG: hypothetical protein K6T65_04780 [Peptococcaceae bacterium]|nr:hypothetical protein [Peptococcaceae bacterium]